MAVPLPLARLKRILCASSAVVYGLQWSMSLTLRIVVVVRSSRSGLHSAAIGLSPARSHLLAVKDAPIDGCMVADQLPFMVDGRPLHQRWRLRGQLRRSGAPFASVRRSRYPNSVLGSLLSARCPSTTLQLCCRMRKSHSVVVIKICVQKRY